MTRETLTGLQRDVLAAFFRRETRFFLTGGAALVGFYLHHRRTKDLDLFAAEAALDSGELALSEAARELGAGVENLMTAPEFRRRLLRKGDETVLVDLVFDRAPQGTTEKPVLEGIRIDPPDEILANKLCALLSRAEIRDIVDVLALEAYGLRIEDGLELANRKDAGLSPAQLGWVLSQVEIGEDADVPGGFTADDLREALRDWQIRLARLAFPQRAPGE